ncbi:MAG: protein activator of alkane oxidation PraB [Pseudomonas sp.]|jgi:hypothetical protein|uniref:alkane oxidation protein activator PraB n=1 Tax=Pseudomonas sp. TaxID=306 RepID=UPI002394C5E4|nr:alkane oxidation protein activator PraB [Pseudomonas sp.]MDP9033075.1 protein activator of alkane oxidation PraB [Pseudomonadota bacterium]MDE1909514.1 protein activator of alkane oxidation PraB [Pseudomonas sp.]MDE2034150.1 protein activator of alkane oxidation PraB [Pseudomonas sp.]MDE2192218.1 protein activator of alkane oxidation PraB [Pseudomonas sp.]MDE2557013.1 protein activator of alkane oxidation PraB [Pseudomonas sp.]|eukprot:gene14515-17617_t
MKSINVLVCATYLAMFFGTISVANGAIFTPAGATFTTSFGSTITLKTPSSFGAAVTCNVQLSGKVRPDGSAIDIGNAWISGSNPLCMLSGMFSVPGMLMPPFSVFGSNGTLINIGYTITGAPPIIPNSNCGLNTIFVTLANAPGNGGVSLDANNQSLSGTCTIVSFNTSFPGISIAP